MCKIFTLLGFEDSELMLDLAVDAVPFLSMNDNDGLGMIGATKDNKIWVEKHLFNETAFRTHDLKDKRYFKRIGKFSEKLDSLIIHTRMACSEVNIRNTHPFSANGVHLVHNGVVDDTQLKLQKSTCDSEGILNLYNDLNVKNRPENFRYLYDYLEGWYACVAVMKWKGKVMIDIFKNDGANLYEVSIKGMNGRIICTDKSHAERVLSLNKLEVANIETFCEDSLCRFLATGEPILMECDVKERRSSTKASYSYGYWDNDGGWEDQYNDQHKYVGGASQLDKDIALIDGYDTDQYGNRWRWDEYNKKWVRIIGEESIYGRSW
jgi:hypothetical protein